ncbi:DNA replication checkpoint tel2-like protein [Cladobotryum mycophilum]|uniref:DNA replication checkpoint tel2-like protein n=1 Tax=Cladobotryum mycophilum TaxID=491253 RepID=A0ABR0SEV3_9HYPO
MDELLTPISTTYLKSRKVDEPLLSEVSSTKRVVEAPRISQILSVDEALELLRNQPDYDSLILVLQYLTTDVQQSSDTFHLHVPGPKSAAIIHQLVTEIVPNYWTLLREGSENVDTSNNARKPDDATLLTQCLQSVAGLNAVLAHLKALIQEQKGGSKGPIRPDVALHLSTFLDLLASLLRGNSSVQTIWIASTEKLTNAALKKTQSHTLLSLLTSGRILSTASEALALVGQDGVQGDARWVAEGVEFTKWIAQNINSWTKDSPGDAELQFCSDLFHRGMSLGYSDTLAKCIIDGLLLSKGSDPSTFTRVYFNQSQSIKKTLSILLQRLSQHLNTLDMADSASNAAISGTAGLVYAITQNNDAIKGHLIDWCASSSGAGLGDNIGIRRAVLAVLAKDKEAITTVFEKGLSQFGDQLYIRHVAILQQNVHTEILLLSAGYVSRLSPIKLRMTIRSGSYLSAISNRIAATQTRARFLGMIVGESLSALIDKNAQKLDFHMEEMDTEEAQWLKSLTTISDGIGPVDSLLKEDSQKPASQPQTKAIRKPVSKPKGKPKAKVTESKPIAIIEEIDSSDDEDDLAPLAKDSDPEDSDDNAELVQRNKVKAPVYVRDLILFFRDSESYDKQRLALQTAPSLIRRKANFGTEVSSHADELAGLFVGLQDKYELENFSDLKLQGMIALIVAQPKLMAPWFCRTFFEGDYSLSQRVQVLVAIGLSGRELAGFETSEYASAAAFPSKRLPEKIEQLYLDPSKREELPPSSRLKGLPPTALNTISQALTSSFLAPMAAKAADATTGPDILKLQTFTARYKSKTKAKPRVRAIPNTTAALLANSFFSPLTAHFQLALRSNKALVLNPALLSLYLQTIGIIIHAAGPSTLSLPQLTAELWDLLLGVRVHAQDDLDALKGWLVAMASLLEVNGGDMRRICVQQGREVVETREWVGGVFHRTRGEDGGEENEVKMLAAGVLIRLGEAIEQYQTLLMGDMVGFQ